MMIFTILSRVPSTAVEPPVCSEPPRADPLLARSSTHPILHLLRLILGQVPVYPEYLEDVLSERQWVLASFSRVS